jgi:gas vesicle protein
MFSLMAAALIASAVAATAGVTVNAAQGKKDRDQQWKQYEEQQTLQQQQTVQNAQQQAAQQEQQRKQNAQALSQAQNDWKQKLQQRFADRGKPANMKLSDAINPSPRGGGNSGGGTVSGFNKPKSEMQGIAGEKNEGIV